MKGTLMKRMIALGLVGLLASGLTACGSTKKEVVVAAPSPSAPAVTTIVAGCKTTTAVPHMAVNVPPPSGLLTEVISSFTLTTNCGEIDFDVYQKKAPQTVTAMTVLARAGYFDGSLCHRLTTQNIYVLQCGDPTARGNGGPAWAYRDENLPSITDNNYPAGTVAMANGGPNSNGSQFFLVYADTSLGKNYSIWGKVTKGLDILKAIADAGVQGGGVDGPPAQTVAIESVSVK